MSVSRIMRSRAVRMAVTQAGPFMLVFVGLIHCSTSRQRGDRVLSRCNRQADGGARAFAVFAVDELDFAAVGVGNLLRQRQPHAAA